MPEGDEHRDEVVRRVEAGFDGPVSVAQDLETYVVEATART